MKLEEIIKLLKEAGVEAGVITAIKSLDNSAEVERLTKEVEAERGKSAGILEDKKKYKERAEKAEGEVKKIADEKLPEDERTQKEITELKDKLERQEAERKADADLFARTQREAKVAELTNSIKWAESTPFSTAKLIVSNALTDFDDLSDEAKIGDALKNVVESHKSFIAANAPSGTGGKTDGKGDSGSGGSNESSIADNQKEIWGDK